MKDFNEKRIRKAMKITYAKARAAIADARGNSMLFRKAALEIVQECRKLNAQRRRAIACGHAI